jgi:glycosyltransferase involved in cell wall biosynthesis
VISILRPTRRTGLLTAQVFETLFCRHVGAAIPVQRAPLQAWCEAILGPLGRPVEIDQAASRFATATAAVQFLCPSWEAVALVPLFAALRNRSRATVRLLLIAHAPGGYALDWALLAPLLAPGDLIVAPSASAKATIEYLCAPLEQYIRVIPHPMQALPRSRVRRPGRFVSLGRLNATKLLHRQIDAMAILRSRRRTLPVLEIAGGTAPGDNTGADAYTRSLVERARRLGVDDKLRFVGVVRGDRRKAALLSGADALVNLSVTVEESFGKAPVEALSAGVPVLATLWDGLPETVGSCGELVRVAAGPSVDADADDIATALDRLLDAPPSAEACRAQAERFSPERIVPRYRDALESALASVDTLPDWPDASLPAAPDAGLLSLVAPLTHFSWREMFKMYLDGCATIRQAWDGSSNGSIVDGDRLRRLVHTATHAPLERFLGGISVLAPPLRRRGPAVSTTTGSGDFLERVAESAVDNELETARVACLLEVQAGGRLDLVQRMLSMAGRAARAGLGVDYATVEALARSDPRRAFELCVGRVQCTPPGESDAHRLRQLARVSRHLDRPEAALPWLERWLSQFPDAPDAGSVWLALAVNAVSAQPPRIDDVHRALARARALLGNVPPVIALARHLEAAQCATALLDGTTGRVLV